jgi:hypothetical protein
VTAPEHFGLGKAGFEERTEMEFGEGMPITRAIVFIALRSFLRLRLERKNCGA